MTEERGQELIEEFERGLRLECPQPKPETLEEAELLLAVAWTYLMKGLENYTAALQVLHRTGHYEEFKVFRDQCITEALALAQSKAN